MSPAIPAQRLHALNTGRVPATHLAECLAVDFVALLQVVAPVLAPEVLQRMRDASGKGITLRMALAAQLLREAGQGAPALWQHHNSDTVRGWACFLVGASPDVSLQARLDRIRPLGDDAQFGVREWARYGRGPRTHPSVCAVSPANPCVRAGSGAPTSRR
ncbi:hypothetical protein G6F50_014567 [Rhizopus delemar]|uniref:Uncharacterized protein n=1 Tax=Rhizopus delemar TaxID=936053 RepID=A0A9P6Y460_9FUNG|nr:hypothetical protein G6F50_014567 [Rhizopus delemar]